MLPQPLLLCVYGGNEANILIIQKYNYVRITCRLNVTHHVSVERQTAWVVSRKGGSPTPRQ